MRYGVREICDVTFRPLADVTIGGQAFKAGEPCLYLTTAKTSSLEGAATTVYAQGGKGNPRLLAWEGEKTITLTIEDALISDESLAMLTGAGFAKETSATTYVHKVYEVIADAANQVTLADMPNIYVHASTTTSDPMPIFGVIINTAGSVKEYLTGTWTYDQTSGKLTYAKATGGTEIASGDPVRIDCYVKNTNVVKTFNITPYDFAGYYYIEADTLFRDEETGSDYPAEFIVPRGKIQSNFTFTMAASGDPSTFTFTIDAFPGYTKQDIQNAGTATKVLTAIQVIGDPLA